MKKVMVVAGGDWQVPITKKAKEMGCYVISSNLYENSPAFKYADESHIANVLDKEKNLEIARKCKPDAVITDQSDIAVSTVAYVTEQMGIRGIGTDKASLFTNKYRMRDFCRKNGFPSISYRLCDEPDEAIEFFKKVGKSIIKPIDSQSSRGVYIIETVDDIKNNFEDTRGYSNAGGKVLIEEYIEGTEFTVDGVMTDDGFYVLAISEKEHYKHNPSIAKRLFFSNNNDRFDYDKLRELNKAMVEKMQLPFGITHAEYKFMGGEYYLIEIAARGGGTRISSDIVPIMSGVDHNRILIEMALGNKVIVEPNINREKCAVLNFLEFPAGKVKEIVGLDKIRQMKNVVDIILDFKEGDEISEPNDDRSRVGFYIAFADTREDMIRICDLVENTLEVKYYEH